MTHARISLGRHGEDIAAARLQAGGWRIVARNARVRGIRGELDIVALEGSALVVVEVKTIRDSNRLGPTDPVEMVGPRKQAQLRSLAGAWLAANRAEVRGTRGLRIDVVGIVLGGAGEAVRFRHVRSAC